MDSNPTEQTPKQEPILDTLKRWYNWVRIRIKYIFSKKVQRFRITGKDGKERDAWTEQTEEKECGHTQIKEVAKTLWQCVDCKQAYFFIHHKLIATEPELIGFLQDIAKVFDAELRDKDDQYDSTPAAKPKAK